MLCLISSPNVQNKNSSELGNTFRIFWKNVIKGPEKRERDSVRSHAASVTRFKFLFRDSFFFGVRSRHDGFSSGTDNGGVGVRQADSLLINLDSSHSFHLETLHNSRVKCDLISRREIRNLKKTNYCWQFSNAEKQQYSF